MSRNPELARWLVVRRREIERALAARDEGATARAASPEAEALRRFRSFAASALLRGDLPAPSLDGLRVNEERAVQLLSAWCGAALEVAGDNGGAAHLKQALEPLLAHFRSALRTTHTARRKRGAPRAGPRAVRAAIDRIADAFLAIDPESGRIVDANPAAGSLLGLTRDELLQSQVAAFVPPSSAEDWNTQLDSLTEGAEPARFRAQLRDARGIPIELDVSMSRFSTRQRTLALVVARAGPAPSATPTLP